MPGDADKVKERLDLVELIGEYIQLQRAGSVNFKARCPFHNEKTPSFYVSKERQMWHCFGCSEGGDHFTFVQKMEGMDFPEALKLLADKAGVKLERYDARMESERTRLLGLLDLAAKFFEKILLEHQGAQCAREYVKSRDIPDSTARAFRIGYALDSWDALSAFLLGRGYREDEILRAGLAARRDQARGIYDRFRGRLMFPISNVHGHVIGFTGRLLDPDAKEQKYVNTPETEFYKKGAVLYALDRAKQAIKREGFVIIVEGNMDAVSSHKIGMEHTVASSGTALTADQLALIKRFTNTILIGFDADVAGQTAAKRGIDLAVASGFTVRIVRIPSGAGKDPDDCIRTHPEEWKQSVAAAVPYMEHLFDILPHGKDLHSADGKRDVGNALLLEISKIPDPIEQTHWLQKLSSTIGVGEAVLRERLHPAAKPARYEHPAPPAAHPTPDRATRLSENFLSLILNYPETAGIAVGLVRPEMLSGADLRALYTRLVVRYTGGSIPRQADDFRLDREVTPLERQLILQGERDFASMENEAVDPELRRYAAIIRSEYLVRERRMVETEMAAAEHAGDRDGVSELGRKFQELLERNG